VTFEPRSSADIVAGTPNMVAPELARIELRDPSRREAVLLLASRFFYADLPPAATLIPELGPSDAVAWCYGVTSARALGSRVESAPSATREGR
jgi:hypothetical protein